MATIPMGKTKLPGIEMNDKNPNESFKMEIESVGTIVSAFKEKFGLPRQSNLVDRLTADLVLDSRFTENSIRGLEEMEFIWILFVFHDNLKDGWSEMVRPPRLGGKIKVGVFATRSPHRPNSIGLSLVKLVGIEKNNHGNVVLKLEGVDFMHGTPVIDIKPYNTHSESLDNIRKNYSTPEIPRCKILWKEEALEDLDSRDGDTLMDLIEKTLSFDPRPAYQNDPERMYFMRIENVEVQFQFKKGYMRICRVVDVSED